MTLHRDHVAGAGLIALGALVLWLGRELPFGTLASPGPGMLPDIATVGLIAFAAVLMTRAAGSPPLASIAWGDLPHAAAVMAAAGVAISLYTTLGFVLTITLLLFGLLAALERVGLVRALAVSLAVTAATYVLIAVLLKSTLPRGPLGL